MIDHANEAFLNGLGLIVVVLFIAAALTIVYTILALVLRRRPRVNGRHAAKSTPPKKDSVK